MLEIKRRIPQCSFEDSEQARNLDPLLRRIYENRNVATLDQSRYSLKQLLPPDRLLGIQRATDILVAAIQRRESIIIIGDYDTDGATATVLAILGLSALGAKKVDYLVPNRFEFGYGLSEKIASLALETNPDVLVTVDNGISSLAGVELVRNNGVKCIITDHHLPGKSLPNADAIVNPNQPDCPFPSKALSGVGVMFYLLLAVRSALRDINWFGQAEGPTQPPNLADYLDLVALGTVADMVPLDSNNRILVAQGIARIRKGQCRPGIIELLRIGGKDYRKVASSDFGFVVGPRLNAAGRLDDISTGIDCLLSSDRQIATEYAEMLDGINSERRRIEKDMQHRAFDIIRSLKLENDGFGYCLYDDQWHQGVTGLVASRVKDKTQQPTIAFAPSADGLLTGSARTIAGLHIRDLLEEIADDDPGLIVKFGGHAMAAGLTIEATRFEAFSNRFQVTLARAVKKAGNLEVTVLSDGELASEQLTLTQAEQLKDAAPWGQGFPSPVFDGIFNVLDYKVVGGQHIKLTVQDTARVRYDAIAFRAVEPGIEPEIAKSIHMAYQLDVNEFRGQRSLQLIVEQLLPAS